MLAFLFLPSKEMMILVSRAKKKSPLALISNEGVMSWHPFLGQLGPKPNNLRQNTLAVKAHQHLEDNRCEFRTVFRKQKGD